MDYEKNYKEALGRAKNLYKDAIDMGENIRAKQCEIIFPELKESEDERIRGAIIDHLKDNNLTEWAAWLEKQKTNDRYIVGVDVGDPDGDKGCRYDYSNANIQQKDFASKEEPTFKVGDWITDDEVVFHITSYHIDYGYQLETQKGTLFHFSDEKVENKYHLWTNKDAKDGNVLVDVYGNIGIFEQYDDFDWVSYCSLGHNGGFQHFKIEHENENTYPATKEQCDLLFQKMHKAGYEWDAEKKELKLLITNGGDFDEKNCEQKPEHNVEGLARGEDYGIDGLWHAINILEKTFGDVSGYQSDDGILSHECAISAVKELYDKKTAEWSEGDERILDALITSLNNEVFAGRLKTLKGIGVALVIDWLKSIKQRIGE